MAAIERSLKSVVKPLLPASVVERWRRFRFDREQERDRGLPLQQVFERIYATNAWATPAADERFSSGPGSDAAHSALHERFVVSHILGDPAIATVVDIGCGDFQVGGRILEQLRAAGRAVHYIGCDIAANVVAYNRERHAGPGVEFHTLDISRELPPAGDLVTIREVFQHLSNEVIMAALANLAQRFDRAIVTESVHPDPKVANIDLVSGYRTRDGFDSGVYVEQPPFNRPVLAEECYDWTPTERLRTTLVELR